MSMLPPINYPSARDICEAARRGAFNLNHTPGSMHILLATCDLALEEHPNGLTRTILETHFLDVNRLRNSLLDTLRSGPICDPPNWLSQFEAKLSNDYHTSNLAEIDVVNTLYTLLGARNCDAFSYLINVEKVTPATISIDLRQRKNKANRSLQGAKRDQLSNVVVTTGSYTRSALFNQHNRTFHPQ